MIKTIFIDFINNINDYNYKYSLYSKILPINLGDEILLEEELYDIKDTIGEFNYIIGVEDIKDIMNNLKMQLPKNNDLQICANAINYYIENDAFIDLK